MRERIRSPYIHRVWQFAYRMRGVALVQNGTLGINPNGVQCVNICNMWFAALGVSQFYGNAVAWVGEQTSSVRWLEPRRRRWLHAGDVAVFRVDDSSPFGHVDVVLDGSRDPYLGLDENWPEGNPVSFVKHSHDSLMGVLRPI